MHRRWLILLGLLAAAPLMAQSPAPPQPASPLTPQRIERLTHLAKMWGAVGYLLPGPPSEEIDWDAVLIRTLPKVWAASTPDQYAAAVQEMVSAACDPALLAAGRPDRCYGEMVEPSLEYRLLAVFQIWNAVHYFHPYLELIGDWDAVLPEFIARMGEVKDGREYALAIAEMAVRTGDGHTSVTGNPTLDRLYGEAPAPVAVRWIEGGWVITGLAGDGMGIEVGDVVLTVDGETVAIREGLLRRYLASSTEAGLRHKLAGHLLSGPRGSTVSLTLMGREERIRKVELRRRPWAPRFQGETVRILPGNLGYVDLDRLTVEEIDGMFERLRETRGIVFDMRGYPRGTGPALASRLNVRGALHGAIFRRREPEITFPQAIEPTDAWIYQGRTVMLIDERTVSQAEHLGLLLEAAAGTKFVGTPTAGANGDVTFFSVPGIASIRFSGLEVRHVDGRQLQKIGLVPDVLVAPTLRGIREGRDEVLERGIAVLKREIAAAGSPAGPAGASGTAGGTSSG